MSSRHAQNDTATFDAMGVFGLAVALSAARSTGLLRLVLNSPRNATECARELKLDARFVAHVLDLLVAANVIEYEDDRYGVYQYGPEAARLTTTRYDILETHLSQTEAALRGEPPRTWLDGGLARREAEYRTISVEMGQLYVQMAVHIADHLPMEAMRILDVGCGSGVWSLEIGRRSGQSRIVGIDFPTVLESFRQRARELGIDGSVSGLPGDFHTIELPKEPFDLVILANILRLEAPDRAASLLSRMASVLRPGGRLLIIDALAKGSPAKDISRAAYALLLALRTNTGRVHSPKQIEEWMTKADIVDITTIDCGLSLGAIGALLGRKVSR